ncbi:MAG TPA: hypothetical protein VJ140_05090 [Actinomycetota bacterium]|nr:hypothetical protein [Actinomycetota bacterium]
MATNPEELQRAFDAETWQGYFPDHARNERTPEPGIDAMHHHFAEYLRSHPTAPPA